MIHIHRIGHRARDGKLFAIVNTKDVPDGVEHSFRFSGLSSKALVFPYIIAGAEPDEDLPQSGLDARNGHYTWVRLDDICPVKVLHVTEYEGRIAAVVDARLVPKDVMRSQARWSVPLDAFINEHHPAEAKDVRYQGPVNLLGDSRCWMFLDQLWGVPHAPAGAAPAKDDPDDIDGLTREECFRRYAEAQTSERMYMRGSGHRGTLLNTHFSELALTKAQLEAAREVWSERLREKTEASAAADKVADESVVGWDPYGDEP